MEKAMKRLDRPVAVWTGEDNIEGILPTLTMILRTKGCFWAKKSGCYMCGFFADSSEDVKEEDILKQFDFAMNNAKTKDKEIEAVKIYTSGSFLDKREISRNVREKIVKELSDRSIKKVIVESRPEFITEENLSSLEEKFIVAIGLETSNDYIRDKFINKGTKFEDYVKSCDLIHSFGLQVKTYLLLKPLFLTERDAILDTINSASDCESYSDYISINPCDVQRNTFLEKIWFKRGYRPPWLWSCIEVLRELSNKLKKPVQMDPVGAGNRRGPHNCGRCDRKIARAIKDFSLHQDSSLLEDLDCDCKEVWREVLEIEEYTFGSPIIM